MERARKEMKDTKEKSKKNEGIDREDGQVARLWPVRLWSADS
ncbi:hypothetical protein P7H17_26720 [Paenibacillus larvae]|nr:hypothetical protein [Paenibacillus larvae]MDT2288927.1 hypothetical protein [Paenibacillus larvae]